MKSVKDLAPHITFHLFEDIINLSPRALDLFNNQEEFSLLMGEAIRVNPSPNKHKDGYYEVHVDHFAVCTVEIAGGNMISLSYGVINLKADDGAPATAIRAHGALSLWSMPYCRMIEGTLFDGRIDATIECDNDKLKFITLILDEQMSTMIESNYSKQVYTSKNKVWPSIVAQLRRRFGGLMSAGGKLYLRTTWGNSDIEIDISRPNEEYLNRPVTPSSVVEALKDDND